MLPEVGFTKPTVGVTADEALGVNVKAYPPKNAHYGHSMLIAKKRAADQDG